VANLFGKDCGPKILREPPKLTPEDPEISLRNKHVLVGNTSAVAEETKLDPERFEVENLDCDNKQLTLKPFRHDELLELEDDDHEQYVHISIDREISADHTFTGDQSFLGTTHFIGGVRDANNALGTNLQVLSTPGNGVLNWKSVSELKIDHGDLLGLEDDDHEQYVHVSIDREISADHIFAGNVEFSGSPIFTGEVRDSLGNTGTYGQVPTTLANGKFEWRTQKIENVFWVAKDGDDSNDGLSPQTAKASIKAAVRASYSGDLGKITDAAESILANKRLILDETANELYIQSFTLPNSTSFDLKSRQAYRLIMQSRNQIVADSIAQIAAQNPAFSDADGKCTRDSRLLVLALAKDLFLGGYENTVKFIQGYFNSNGAIISNIFTPTELTLTISTFNAIRDRINNTTLSSSTFAYIRTKVQRLIGYTTTSLSTNSLNALPTTSGQEQVKQSIYYNLESLVETVWNSTALSFPTVTSTESTCKRDIKLVAISMAEDIESWGFSRMIAAAKSYFESAGIFANIAERQASAYAYTELRNAIRLYTLNVALRTHIDLAFNYIITALNTNSVAFITDTDEGILNKSARLCNRDLGLFIDAVASDMKNGGNVFSVEFAEGYYDGNTLIHVSGQLTQTLWAFNRARQLMILAMKNWRVDENDTLFSPQFSLEKIFIDNSIIYDEWPACANAETAINNYYGIIQYILENGPNATAKQAKMLIYEDIGKGDDPNSIVNAVWRETTIAYPSIEFTEGKCKRDLILVLEAVAEDLYSGGNSNTLRVIRSYFPESGNPIEAQVTESVYAYQLARDYINNNLLVGTQYSDFRARVTTLIGALTSALLAGNLDSIPAEDPGTWTVQQPSFKTTIFVNPGVYWEDNPINLPPNTAVTGDSLRGITVNAMNRTLDLFHVNNACGLSFMTFSNHLAPSYAVSFPKKNKQGTAGIISRSPYIQQCTSITTTGGGMLVDGAITEGFKSMVLDSYTQYNQGGPGVKIINNGYAQLVSLFTISCSAGIECAGGGQCDLTNSNSSLGDYGLVADGLGKTEIIATVLEDTPQGSTRVRVKVPGKLKPYNGQAGYFGAPYFTVQEIKVINKGAGYTSSPLITIGEPTGPLAIPARARAVVDNGSVDSITILKGGTSYISTPTISIEPPTGPGAIPPTLEVVMAPLYYRVVSSTDLEPDGSTTISLVTPTLYPIAKGSSFVLARQSKVLASGHSFEYIGAGPNIRTALPIRNGTFIQQQEVEERRGGSVIFTSTDQSGNFRIGDGVIIDQASGTIGGVSFSRGLFAQITPLILALQ
jgi:hypothetical protein